MAALQRDTLHPRGERRLNSAELDGLKRFEWNSRNSFYETCRLPLKTSIGRAAGQAAVRWPKFRTPETVTAPSGASHCRLTALLLAVDMEGNQCTPYVSESGLWTLDGQVPADTLTPAFPPAIRLPLLLCLAIRFYETAHSALQPMKQGEALVIAAVEAAGF